MASLIRSLTRRARLLGAESMSDLGLGLGDCDRASAELMLALQRGAASQGGGEQGLDARMGFATLTPSPPLAGAAPPPNDNGADALPPVAPPAITAATHFMPVASRKKRRREPDDEACAELEELYWRVPRRDVTKLAWSSSNSDDERRQSCSGASSAGARPHAAPSTAARGRGRGRGSGAGRGQGRQPRYMQLRPSSDDAWSIASKASPTASSGSD